MKYLSTILSVIAIAVVGFMFVGSGQDTTVKGGLVDAVVGKSTATATTTYQYLTTADAASTTLTSNIKGADIVAIDVCTLASTSASVLNYSVWFSMKEVDATDTTWFRETSPSVSSATVTVLPVTRSVSLATSSTAYMCWDDLVSPVGAKQMRVKYGVSGANAAVWMSIAPRVGY